MDYWYHERSPRGMIRRYTEYKGDMNDGIHMTFDTNAVVRLFMNASNNYIVGEGYEFNESGNIIFAQTTSVPTVSLEYRHHPPK
jgi:antitoxin component YwqK of YwqJK toxin-antitoxin module